MEMVSRDIVYSVSFNKANKTIKLCHCEVLRSYVLSALY